MLTLSRADGGSVMDACGSVAMLEAALAKALPPGCCVANVYLWQGQARVRLGIDDVAAMAALRDEILLGSGFEEKLNEALPRWRRPATDAELPGLGFEKLVTTSGREFYVKKGGKKKGGKKKAGTVNFGAAAAATRGMGMSYADLE